MSNLKFPAHSREGNKLWCPATVGRLPANVGMLRVSAISECATVILLGIRKSKALPQHRCLRSCLVDLQLMVFFHPRRAENRTFRPPMTQRQKTF